MSRQYGAIPLHVPFDMSTVHSMTKHNDLLYVALDGGLIKRLTINISNKGIIKFEQQETIRVKVEGYEICNIKSFNDQLLVHIRSKSGTPGPLLALASRGTLERLDDSTDCFSPNQFSDSKTIAIVSEKRLFIKQYDGTKFNQIFSREFPEPAVSVAMTYPIVCMISNTKLFIVDITTNTVQDINTFGSTNPFVLARGQDNFFTYSGLSAMAVDKNLSSDLIPMTFEKPAIEHARCGQLIASMGSDNVTVFDFKHHKGIVSIKDCRTITNFDTVFLAATSRDIYSLRDMTEAFEHVLAGSIDTAAQSLPNQAIDTLAALFEMTWNNGRIVPALDLLRLRQFEAAVTDVLSIFEFLQFQPPLPASGRCAGATRTNDREHARALLDVLLSIRETVGDDTREYVDTAIIETLSFLDEHMKLCDFFETNHAVLEESLSAFFKNKNESVSYGIFLSSLGRHEEAIEVLARTDAVEAAGRVIAANSSDWDFVRRHVAWLFERAPQQACLVLASEGVEIAKARAFVAEQFPEFGLRFLMAALKNKDVISRRGFVNELVIGLMKLLIKRDTDRKQFRFLDCVIADPSCPDAAVEKELSDRLIEILRTFQGDVDIGQLMPFVTQIPVAEVQVLVYTAAGCLAEALELVWADGVDACEKFCRACEDPARAFSCFFGLLKRKGVRAPEIMRLVAANMEMVDVGDALGQLDEDTDLADVIGALKSAHAQLSSERHSREVAAAFAESAAREAEYDRAVAIAGSVALDEEKTCSGCGKALGFQYIVRRPNGMLYHYKCLPVQK